MRNISEMLNFRKMSKQPIQWQSNQILKSRDYKYINIEFQKKLKDMVGE